MIFISATQIACGMSTIYFAFSHAESIGPLCTASLSLAGGMLIGVTVATLRKFNA